MKSIIITLSIVLFSTLCYSQANYSEEYGKVTQYEMSMTECPGDSEAEALVIYDFGKYYFRGLDNKGFRLFMEIRKKVKILKQAGIDYATIEIPYYIGDSNEREYIQDFEATTYNFEDGTLKKSKFDQGKMFEEKISNDTRVKKIALPDVREGSVIEYKYTIETPYFFNMRRWFFQSKIPVLNSSLEYRAIPYYEYTYITRGTNQFDEAKVEAPLADFHFAGLTYKEKVYTFRMINLPAFRDEEYISSDKDYMVSISFQLSRSYSPYNGVKRDYMSTWPDMCNEFLKDPNFGKYIKDSEKEAKKILPTLDIEDKTPLEKAKIITQYVRSMYSWDEFNGKYTSEKLSTFLKQKKGNDAEMNLFLVGLLKTAGIDAEPVVLSTRGNGVITKTFPFQQFLNYVVVRATIDNQTYFIDTTEPLRYFDELPSRCINVEGLIVKKDSEEWVNIVQKELSVVDKKFNIKVLPDENLLDVDISYELAGQDAYIYRNLYNGKEDDLKEFFRKKNNINEMDSLTISNYKELDKPFNFSFSTKIAFERTPDKLFIHPFCNLSISDNYFKQEKRTLPIDLIYLEAVKYESIIEIPEGYKVDYLPEALKHDGRIMTINYKAQVDGNKIYVNADFKFTSNMYDPKDYIRLKNTFSILIKRFSDMVVLIKE